MQLGLILIYSQIYGIAMFCLVLQNAFELTKNRDSFYKECLDNMQNRLLKFFCIGRRETLKAFLKGDERKLGCYCIPHNQPIF